MPKSSVFFTLEQPQVNEVSLPQQDKEVFSKIGIRRSSLEKTDGAHSPRNQITFRTVNKSELSSHSNSESMCKERTSLVDIDVDSSKCVRNPELNVELLCDVESRSEVNVQNEVNIQQAMSLSVDLCSDVNRNVNTKLKNESIKNKPKCARMVDRKSKSLKLGSTKNKTGISRHDSLKKLNASKGKMNKTGSKDGSQADEKVTEKDIKINKYREIDKSKYKLFSSKLSKRKVKVHKVGEISPAMSPNKYEGKSGKHLNYDNEENDLNSPRSGSKTSIHSESCMDNSCANISIESNCDCVNSLSQCDNCGESKDADAKMFHTNSLENFKKDSFSGNTNDTLKQKDVNSKMKWKGKQLALVKQSEPTNRIVEQIVMENIDQIKQRSGHLRRSLSEGSKLNSNHSRKPQRSVTLRQCQKADSPPNDALDSRQSISEMLDSQLSCYAPYPLYRSSSYTNYSHHITSQCSYPQFGYPQNGLEYRNLSIQMGYQSFQPMCNCMGMPDVKPVAFPDRQSSLHGDSFGHIYESIEESDNLYNQKNVQNAHSTIIDKPLPPVPKHGFNAKQKRNSVFSQCCVYPQIVEEQIDSEEIYGSVQILNDKLSKLSDSTQLSHRDRPPKSLPLETSQHSRLSMPAFMTQHPMAFASSCSYQYFGRTQSCEWGAADLFNFGQNFPLYYQQQHPSFQLASNMSAFGNVPPCASLPCHGTYGHCHGNTQVENSCCDVDVVSDHESDGGRSTRSGTVYDSVNVSTNPSSCEELSYIDDNIAADARKKVTFLLPPEDRDSSVSPCQFV